jgi:DnaJ homolog subfamily A member 2
MDKVHSTNPGETMNERDKCRQCNGRKIATERKILEVYIDKGMKNGQEIRFTGDGDQEPNQIPGDIVIILDEKPHPRFKRQGDDLYITAQIDLLTALAGGQFAIQQLDDSHLVVSIIPGEIIKPGATKAIKDRGMPAYFRLI